MPIYQIQYKKNSHTYVSDIESNSKDSALNLFKKIIVAEVLEIREYIYKKQSYKKDDSNYYNSISFSISREDYYQKIVIKKIRKNKSIDEIVTLIKSHIRLKDSSKFNISQLKFT